MSELMFPSLTDSVTGSKLESCYGDEGQDCLLYYGLMLCRSWCYPAELACNESCFGEVDQDDMFMLQSKSMSELMSSSLTGIKTAECLFGEKAKFFLCIQ